MIDLHAHVLPGLDDGPATPDESLALLRAMAEQGVTRVVAAVHTLDGRYRPNCAEVVAATELVNGCLADAGLEIRVLPGMEIFLGFDTLRAVRQGQVLGVNGSRHLVVELPGGEYPAYTDRAIFELMIAGYRPILNHPERNAEIRRRPQLLERLAERGVPAMVTAASLLGRFGPGAQAAAERFLQEGLATLVVSDAHDLAGRRPLLREGLEAARRLGKVDQQAELALLKSAG